MDIRYVRAHNLLTLHYSDDQTDYPIDYRFWKAPDIVAIEAAFFQYKKPVLQETYQTKLHLDLEMFKGFCEQYPDLRLPFSFDSWFTQPDFCRQVAQLNRIYVKALKTSKQIQLAGNLRCFAKNVR